MNSVGVEGYDENKPECRFLKESLHLKTLEYVSTRDDIETLVNKYFDGKVDVPCDRVADPAVWAAEVFGHVKDDKSKIVGIGVGNFGMFEAYGRPYTADLERKFYLDVVRGLYMRGGKCYNLYEWRRSR